MTKSKKYSKEETKYIKEKIIELLSEGYSITKACKEIPISRSFYYQNLNTDKVFSDKCRQIKESQKRTHTTTGEQHTLKEQVVNLLCDAFRLNYKVTEACRYANISRQAFYEVYRNNTDFAYRIDRAKDYPYTAAKALIIQEMLSRKSTSLAKWLLERRQPEDYSPSVTERNSSSEEKKSLGELAAIVEERKRKGENEKDIFNRSVYNNNDSVME